MEKVLKKKSLKDRQGPSGESVLQFIMLIVILYIRGFTNIMDVSWSLILIVASMKSYNNH